MTEFNFERGFLIKNSKFSEDVFETKLKKFKTPIEKIYQLSHEHFRFFFSRSLVKMIFISK